MPTVCLPHTGRIGTPIRLHDSHHRAAGADRTVVETSPAWERPAR